MDSRQQFMLILGTLQDMVESAQMVSDIQFHTEQEFETIEEKPSQLNNRIQPTEPSRREEPTGKTHVTLSFELYNPEQGEH